MRKAWIASLLAALFFVGTVSVTPTFAAGNKQTTGKKHHKGKHGGKKKHHKHAGKKKAAA